MPNRDYVVVRAETRTPDIASSAAEVADSAMILDREVSAREFTVTLRFE